jgi:hypothetical protein
VLQGFLKLSFSISTMIFIGAILACTLYIFDGCFLRKLLGGKEEYIEEDIYRSISQYLKGRYDIIINYDTLNNENEIWGSLMVYKLTSKGGQTATKTIYEKNDWLQQYKSPPQATLIKANVKAKISAEVKSFVNDLLSEKTPQKPRNIMINRPGGEDSEVITVEEPGKPTDKDLYSGEV